MWLAISAGYLVYMGLRYDGRCSTLEWPGLAPGGDRPCDFYEFFATSLDTPFWPLTVWQALAIAALLAIVVPAVVGWLLDRAGRAAGDPDGTP